MGYKRNINMNSKLLLALFAVIPLAHGGFRCTFGNWACTTGCVFLGQTSGICDADWNCHCSEKSISVNNFRALLPSRCNLGESFFQGTCQALARHSGYCDQYGCTCSEKYLTPSEFLLCAAESTCRTHCQAQGSATGVCLGWSCQCKSSDSEARTALEQLMAKIEQ